jgi:Tfp pilus assembly protein PilZ
MVQQRRALARAKKRFSCTIVSEGRRYSAVIINISATGVFVQTSAKVDIGSVVQLEMHIPGCDEPVLADAQVARQKVVPHELRSVEKGGLGLRIILPPPEFLEYYASAMHVEIPGGGPSPEAKPAPARKATPKPVKKVPEKTTEIAYRVRLGQIGGSRTRTVNVTCDTLQEAESAALRKAGDEWKVLAVEPVRGG